MEFETFFGFVGLSIFICALFDFEWFFRMTKSARRGYEVPFTRRNVRIFGGVIGFFWMVLGFS
jgi:hypothetical protein